MNLKKSLSAKLEGQQLGSLGGMVFVCTWVLKCHMKNVHDFETYMMQHDAAILWYCIKMFFKWAAKNTFRPVRDAFGSPIWYPKVLSEQPNVKLPEVAPTARVLSIYLEPKFLESTHVHAETYMNISKNIYNINIYIYICTIPGSWRRWLKDTGEQVWDEAEPLAPFATPFHVWRRGLTSVVIRV